VSYLWQQTGGPAVTLLNSTTDVASFTAPSVSEDITLTFSFTATDNDAASSSDSVTITITDTGTTPDDNTPPVVDVGSDYEIFDGESTSITATVNDPDELDDIVSTVWSQIDNSGLFLLLNNASSLTVDFIAPDVSQDTIVTLRLTATDSNGAIGYDDVSVTIRDGSLSSGILNDTGVTLCSDADSNEQACPVADYPRQDAEYGRDYWVAMGYITKQGAGNAGFDFTKMDVNGNNISENSTVWSCVRDNVTGLLWEAKQIAGTGDAHDSTNLYTWYNPSSNENAGEPGEDNFDGQDNCPGYDQDNSKTYCNTKNQIEKFNDEAYCGITTWRLPSIKELQSIVDFSESSPSVDTNFFKHTSNTDYWTATSNSVINANALTINFFNGGQRSQAKSKAYRLRLVAGN
jgi:hypothetical protein